MDPGLATNFLTIHPAHERPSAELGLDRPARPSASTKNHSPQPTQQRPLAATIARQRIGLGIGFALIAALATSSTSAPAPAKTPDDRFTELVVPFLTQHCGKCHQGQNAEASFDAMALRPNFADLTTKARWAEVINVLNSHSMPPESEPPPPAATVAAVVDWLTQQIASVELASRDSAIVLRRLNRLEYRHTLRDLLGVDVDISSFPQDPPAGGFDNNGRALTLSPMLLELYYQTAERALDRAIVTSPQPPPIRWRFEPETGDGDHNRVTYDGQRVIVNGGNNRVQDGFKILHHESWDRHINIRDFALPHPGRYVLRIRAAGLRPTRDHVVATAEKFLRQRQQQDDQERPQNARYHQQAYDETLDHFRSHPMYDYGPPRLKLVQTLAGQPRIVTETDIEASLTEPQVYEIPLDFTTQPAGFEIQYAYSIPRELENFWFQTSDDFARPELWIDWIELVGPLHEAWPPTSHQQLLQTTEVQLELTNPAQRRDKAAEIVKRLMQRAYRRPVSPDELAAKLALFDPDQDDFLQAIRPPLLAVLVSPHFLYLTEPQTEPQTDSNTGQRRRLNAFELASRLSYFLWSSMPDDRLFRLATTKQLLQPEVLSTEVERMLADEKSTAFVSHFAGQWLGLREVGANPPAADLFPRYDRHLEQSMIREGEAFFAEILRHDHDVMNFVKSDFVVINERLARYYGIPNVRGDQFRPVTVPPNVQRGGLLTQAAMLTITSNGTRTSPVKRGTWILKNLLGMDPGLPVANAGDIAPRVPGIDKATVRQRLEIHRELPQCARCHNKIDPLGLALENYDAAGAYREQEGFGYKGRIGPEDPPIDASAKMIDGTEFVGPAGLAEVLLQQEDYFLRCLASKLLTYALGRELGVADGLQVKAAVDAWKQDQRTLRRLIHGIVQSELFQTR